MDTTLFLNNTIPTEIFTRQILKSATVKITGIPKIPSILKSVILTGDSASKSLLSVDTQRPLSVNLAKLPIQKSEEFEVGNAKNYRHPNLVAQTLHHLCRATLVAVHCVAFSALRFRNVARESRYTQEPLNAPFLNGLFSNGSSRGKTAPQGEIGETPH